MKINEETFVALMIIGIFLFIFLFCSMIFWTAEGISNFTYVEFIKNGFNEFIESTISSFKYIYSRLY
jgi:hypothetical protein